MSDITPKTLSPARRQIDMIVRHIVLMKGQARDARTVSKAMLVMKLEALEGHARELEQTLERLNATLGGSQDIGG